MSPGVYDLNPVTRITAGAIGRPGKRTFYLQARQGKDLVTLMTEKEQVHALALAIDELLGRLAKDAPEDIALAETIRSIGMNLEEPIEPAFRIGQLGLGYDESHGYLVIVAYETPPEPEEGQLPSEMPPIGVARFWATPAQMRALSQHAAAVVAAGRPICVMCGQPIDPEGHFCPRRNGHH